MTDNVILKVFSPDQDLREYILQPGTNSIGRMVDNNIHLPEESSSRHHAEIIFDQDDSSIKIHDLGSINGTYINGKQIQGLTPLEHEDKVRIGFHLIEVLKSVPETSDDPTAKSSKHKLSKELLIESIDQYAVLLHDVGVQLNTVSDLEIALGKAANSIRRMINANKCKIILAEEFDRMEDNGIPASIANEAIEQKSAMIIPDVQADPVLNKIEHLKKSSSLLIVPVIDYDEVLALIYVDKEKNSSKAFDQRDLRLIIAIGHQITLAIQRNQVEKDSGSSNNFDALTGLPNRTIYLDRLKQVLVKTKRKKDYLFAVMFIDLDDFKLVNDSLGHLVGDDLLSDVAQRLQKHVREGDTIARLGGDEFAFIVDDINDIEAVITIAERIHEQFKLPFQVNKKDYYITASIGITLNTMGYDQPEDMLRDADIAMYRAKEFGKARFEVYDQEMHDRLMEHLNTQESLRKAVTSEEFQLHYQPVISLKTDRVIGFEALLRWDSPEAGLIFPKKFFSVSDTTGLLTSIDLWVLKRGCEQLVELQKLFPTDPPLFISVNLSGKQIKHPNLIEQVAYVLDETGLDANSLWLEIPESTSFHNSDATLDVLKKFKDMGVMLSLDDFGTGFSSLNYLHSFPIDALKIDRSFVSRINGESGNLDIIQAIVSMAKSFGMLSIAEGVETDEQLSLIKSLGCDYTQGFLFSEALELEALVEFLSKDPHW